MLLSRSAARGAARLLLASASTWYAAGNSGITNSRVLRPRPPQLSSAASPLSHQWATKARALLRSRKPPQRARTSLNWMRRSLCRAVAELTARTELFESVTAASSS
ncbi:unnamed protein product [Sphagnum jensenii]|uniref:Secreted protein n=1 Tax=Sphagnum jensenii TaxID=128206 RepID=A0ABP0V7G9_9BRYO